MLVFFISFKFVVLGWILNLFVSVVDDGNVFGFVFIVDDICGLFV